MSTIPQRTHLRIRRFGLASATWFGLVLGMLGSVPSACLVALLASRIVSGLRQLMEAAAQGRLSFLGQSITVNVVDMLHMTPVLEALRALDAATATVALAIALALTLAGALFIAAMTFILAAVYNVLAALTGGMEIEVSGLSAPGPAPLAGGTAALAPERR
jgi:hypothetical protein